MEELLQLLYIARQNKKILPVLQKKKKRQGNKFQKGRTCSGYMNGWGSWSRREIPNATLRNKNSAALSLPLALSFSLHTARPISVL